MRKISSTTLSLLLCILALTVLLGLEHITNKVPVEITPTITTTWVEDTIIVNTIEHRMVVSLFVTSTKSFDECLKIIPSRYFEVDENGMRTGRYRYSATHPILNMTEIRFSPPPPPAPEVQPKKSQLNIAENENKMSNGDKI